MICAPTPRDMSSAPKDGTRILLHVIEYAWDRQTFRQVRIGTRWVEGWWMRTSRYSPYSWREWCGNEKHMRLGDLYPIEWLPRPGENEI